MSSSFTPASPRTWSGRYARIPGETTAFHVRLSGGIWWPFVDWYIDGDTAHCPMVAIDGAAALAEAVHQGKRRLGGHHGGSFLVNEFGRVLVPSPFGDGRVINVGLWSGGLRFENTFRPGTTFDLTDVAGLRLGSPWGRPYLGVPHNLSAFDEIYFWEQDQSGAGKLLPPRQDESLVQALRTLRPSGPVRFVVGLKGIVLTKVPTRRLGQTHWEARYIGRLDYKRWYGEEE